MQVRILTFVSNLNGDGPGHSAVAVGSTVYTFEDVSNGWLQGGSGWKKLDYDQYLRDNTHRPVLAQTIQSATPSYVTEYVEKSIKNDDDYLGSGVCSQQVSRAVNYSLPENIIFDPKGFDTPFGVYHCARRLGIVTSEEYKWSGRKEINYRAWQNIFLKLAYEYPLAKNGLEKAGEIYR
ncbi:MAG: hypothetical protein AAB336_08750 [Acidobacteriota bacterium]